MLARLNLRKQELDYCVPDSDARGFFTSKKTTLFFTGFLTGFFLPVKTLQYM